MAKDYTIATMSRLVRDSTAARNSRTGHLEHPATAEIYRRLPADLERWFAIVMYEEQDPLAIRCGPIDQTDQGFFERWREKRDESYPELNPNYRPPEDDDGGDDGAPVSPTRP
ncbi:MULTISPECIES: hypothetical protein [unclassified Pannonibacter]|uniref:hypothetical protein n=1 Tax=unclassified Pannonibacter TaxID=2627228 RepID=UPI00164824F7|nr:MULTISPECIES: hypothetical protein [unclassified Pannonibacter]